MAKAALSPRNEGDGVAGHPTPTPHVYVYESADRGRGGMFDYMTYNTRVVHVLYEMAVNAGWDATKAAEVRGRLQNDLELLRRASSAPTPSRTSTPPTPSTTPPACRASRSPTGTSAAQHYLDVLDGGSRNGYYEPQLLGPVTLTHSIAR